MNLCALTDSAYTPPSELPTVPSTQMPTIRVFTRRTQRVALAAGIISPLSPTIRIRCFGVRFDSNLCTRPVRSTLWAPICGRPSTTPQALGLPLLVHNLSGRPILYLVGHKRPPSSDYRRTPAQSRCCGGSAMAPVHICVAFRQAWRGIEPIASGT